MYSMSNELIIFLNIFHCLIIKTSISTLSMLADEDIGEDGTWLQLLHILVEFLSQKYKINDNSNSNRAPSFIYGSLHRLIERFTCKTTKFTIKVPASFQFDMVQLQSILQISLRASVSKDLNFSSLGLHDCNIVTSHVSQMMNPERLFSSLLSVASATLHEQLFSPKSIFIASQLVGLLRLASVSILYCCSNGQKSVPTVFPSIDTFFDRLNRLHMIQVESFESFIAFNHHDAGLETAVVSLTEVFERARSQIQYGEKILPLTMPSGPSTNFDSTYLVAIVFGILYPLVCCRHQLVDYRNISAMCRSVVACCHSTVEPIIGEEFLVSFVQYLQARSMILAEIFYESSIKSTVNIINTDHGVVFNHTKIFVNLGEQELNKICSYVLAFIITRGSAAVVSSLFGCEPSMYATLSHVIVDCEEFCQVFPVKSALAVGLFHTFSHPQPVFSKTSKSDTSNLSNSSIATGSETVSEITGDLTDAKISNYLKPSESMPSLKSLSEPIFSPTSLEDGTDFSLNETNEENSVRLLALSWATQSLLPDVHRTYEMVSEVEPESLRHILIHVIVKSLFNENSNSFSDVNWKSGDLVAVNEALRSLDSVEALIAWHSGRGDLISVATVAIEASTRCLNQLKLQQYLLIAFNAMILSPDLTEIVFNHNVYTKQIVTFMASLAYAQYLLETFRTSGNNPENFFDKDELIYKVPSTDRVISQIDSLKLSMSIVDPNHEDKRSLPADWYKATSSLVKNLLKVGKADVALDLLVNLDSFDPERGVFETIGDGWNDLIVYLVANYCSPSRGWVDVYYMVSRCSNASLAAEDILKKILAGKFVGKLKCQAAYSIAFVSYSKDPGVSSDRVPAWLVSEFAAFDCNALVRIIAKFYYANDDRFLEILPLVIAEYRDQLTPGSLAHLHTISA